MYSGDSASTGAPAMSPIVAPRRQPRNFCWRVDVEEGCIWTRPASERAKVGGAIVPAAHTERFSSETADCRANPERRFCTRKESAISRRPFARTCFFPGDRFFQAGYKEEVEDNEAFVGCNGDHAAGTQGCEALRVADLVRATVCDKEAEGFKGALTMM